MRIRQPRRSATALIEFAFVAPLFFMVLFGIFEYARLLFAWQLIHNAAREGARYAVVSIETATTAQVRTYVNKYLAGQGAAQFVGFNVNSNIQVFKVNPATGGNSGQPWTDCGWGDYVGVRVFGNYRPVTPVMLFLPNTLPLSATCAITTEAN